MNIQLSKTLSYILRHGAKEENIQIDNQGFVLIEDILKNKLFKKVTQQQIIDLVQNCPKKRFEIKQEKDQYYVWATQGHSMKFIKDEGLLQQIDLDYLRDKKVIHGTQKSLWEIIYKTGLNKMSRNHIHFTDQYPENKAISGMRSSCDLFIEIDVEKAIRDGIKFFFSKNNVILSSGINGVIPHQYFSYVFEKENGIKKLIYSN